MEYKIVKKDSLTFIKVINDNSFEVTLCDLGASIYTIKYNNEDMTMVPLNIIDFKKENVFYGKTIGPAANRIENAEAIINGKKYLLNSNENGNCLHSGKEGWSNKLFSYEINKEQDLISISFFYFAKDLEGGFPGNRKVHVNYKILKTTNKIKVEYDVISDKDTLLGLTNHSYFCLGRDSLDDMKIKINAKEHYHPRPKDLIPQEIRTVNKIMDFSNTKSLMDDIKNEYLVNSKTNGYDHHFIFEKIDSENPQIILENKKYKMNISTDFEGVQIYTDNYEDETPINWNSSKKDKNRSIAIEPEENYFPRKIYKSGERFSHFITYEFIMK